MSGALVSGIAAGTAISGFCLYHLVLGLALQPSLQGYWDVSRFLAYLLGGLLSALAAVASGEVLRRRDRALLEGTAPALLVFSARVMLGVQVFALLYCNVGAVRSLSITVVRTVVTFGMARDLPN